MPTVPEDNQGYEGLLLGTSGSIFRDNMVLIHVPPIKMQGFSQDLKWGVQSAIFI